jgi:hypothetical protein
MQKGNEPGNVVLLGFLKDFGSVTGNEPPSPSFGAAWGAWAFDRMHKMNRM